VSTFPLTCTTPPSTSGSRWATRDVRHQPTPATAALGDIVFLELPDVAPSWPPAAASRRDVESTKSVSELFSPVARNRREINQAAVDDPSLVNSDPYGAGWLVKAAATEHGPLLSADEYRAQVPAD